MIREPDGGEGLRGGGKERKRGVHDMTRDEREREGEGVVRPSACYSVSSESWNE